MGGRMYHANKCLSLLLEWHISRSTRESVPYLDENKGVSTISRAQQGSQHHITTVSKESRSKQGDFHIETLIIHKRGSGNLLHITILVSDIKVNVL